MLSQTTTRRPLPAHDAEDTVRAAGLLPAEPYSGWATRRWLLCCAECATEHRRCLAEIQQGWRCPHTLRSTGVRPGAVTADRAAAEARAAGYQPEERYPGRTLDPWRLRCTACGQARTPSLKAIRSGERCQHASTHRTHPGPVPAVSEDTRHRLALARQITSPGNPWRTAIEHVPRHLLIPAFYVNPGSWHQLTAPGPRYLPLLHADRPLVTALAPPRPGSTRRQPSATATRTSLIHTVLTAADLDVDQQILDVGTGTGYTAALLCEQFGEGAVTTLDTDPETTALTARRLAAAGYHPRVQTGHIAAPATGYDRIIATGTRLSRLPTGWFTTPGTVIVARLGNGLVRAVSHGNGNGTARFLDHDLSTDPEPPPQPQADPRGPLTGAASTDTTSTAVHDLITHGPPPALAFALELALPGHRWHTTGPTAIRITTPDRSTATVHNDGTVHHRGRRRLWRIVEHLHRHLPTDPAASPTAFGITISRDHQTLWYGDPDRTLCSLT